MAYTDIQNAILSAATWRVQSVIAARAQSVHCMGYQNMERMRSPGKPVVQTRSSRQRKKPLLAVTVKRAKMTDFFKQPSARRDDEESSGEAGRGCVMLGVIN